MDGVDKALTRADKKITKAIDSGDHGKVTQAVKDSEGSISDAIGL